MNNNVASFRSGNKEILDWRNLSLRTRIKIAYALIFRGWVDIEWGSIVNKILLEEEEDD